MKSRKITIGINGKFFGPLNGSFSNSSGTGVQRVAEEIILKLDEILQADYSISERFSIQILVPNNIQIKLALKVILIKKISAFTGVFRNIPWEQISLPWLFKGKYLLNLCVLAPVFSRKSIVMMHDAQIYTSPKSYSLFFKVWYMLHMHFSGLLCFKIITISEYAKSELVKYRVAKPEKITVIHNGCDHVLKIEADENCLIKHNLTNKKYFVAQANTQLHKNINVLLDAFASEKLKDFFLVLYGSANKKNFESKGFFVPKNVIFTNRISDSELKSLFYNAQSTLTPSLTEGFGLQPLEGMILGCPAIVAPCGALPEVCGEAVLYADPYKSDEWVNQICNLIDNQELSTTFSRLGKLHASQFTWENSVKKILNIFSN